MAGVRLAIACGQFAAAPGDSEGNLATIRRMAAEAAGRGARLIVFPELCVSGYLPAEQIIGLAVRADGPEIGHAAESARRSGTAICLGFAELAADGRRYDSMALLGADGSLVAVGRKAHLFGGEGAWAAAGDAVAPVDLLGIRVGMWVCYDTRFPEVARLHALQGATLCLAGAAWLGPADEWELAVRSRAMDNGIWVAGAALQGRTPGRPASGGPAAGFAFHGASLVADPHGRVAARGRAGADEVIVAEYDGAAVEEFRARVPLLEHRRADLCGPLACRVAGR